MSVPYHPDSFAESDDKSSHDESLPIPHITLNMFGPTYRPTQAISLYPSNPPDQHHLQNIMARYDSELLSLPPPTFTTEDSKKQWFQNLRVLANTHGRPHVTTLVYAGGDDRRHRAFHMRATPTKAVDVDISSAVISNPCVTPIHFSIDRAYRNILVKLYPKSILDKSEEARAYLRSLYSRPASRYTRASQSSTSTQLSLTLASLFPRYNPHHDLSSLAVKTYPNTVDNTTLVLAELESLVGSLTITSKLRNPSLAHWAHPPLNADIPSHQPVVLPSFIADTEERFLLFIDLPQLTVLDVDRADTTTCATAAASAASLRSPPLKRKAAAQDPTALADVLALAPSTPAYRGGATEYLLHKRYRSGPTARGNGWVSWLPVHMHVRTHATDAPSSGNGAGDGNGEAAGDQSGGDNGSNICLATAVSAVPDPSAALPPAKAVWTPAHFPPASQSQAKNMQVCDLGKMMQSMRDFAVKDAAKGAAIKGFFGEPCAVPEGGVGDLAWLQRSERAVVPAVDVTRFVRGATQDKGVHALVSLASTCVLRTDANADANASGDSVQPRVVPSVSGRPGLSFLPPLAVEEMQLTLKSQVWQRMRSEKQRVVARKALEGIAPPADAATVDEAAVDTATELEVRERVGLVCALDSVLADDGECAWVRETLSSTAANAVGGVSGGSGVGVEVGVMGVPLYWEARNSALLSQLIAAVRGLRQGGMMVATLAETCSPFALSALYTCYRLFCEVHVVTTRSGAGTYTGERTLVCRGLRQGRPRWVEGPLVQLQREFEKTGKCISGTWVVDPDVISRDTSFLQMMARQTTFRCELDAYWTHTLARGYAAEMQEKAIGELLSQISAEMGEQRVMEEERVMEEWAEVMAEGGVTEEEVLSKVEAAATELVIAERRAKTECMRDVRHKQGLLRVPTIPAPLLGAKVSDTAVRAWLHWRK